MANRRLHDLAPVSGDGYSEFLSGIDCFLANAKRAVVRSVNGILTTTYWEIGRRIVEFDQGGKKRANYGKQLLIRLAEDLSAKHGRGFGVVNLTQMRRFYLVWPQAGILQTPSEESELTRLPFPLPWSFYVRLLSVDREEARSFYEREAIRGGWSVRQLDRQINSQFFERSLLSRRKAAALAKGGMPRPEDAVSPEEEIKDPYVLEFLNLKDEYSESDLEDALVRHLESFLLELGDDFAFIGRQRRLRIDDQWFRVDLLFFHRRLRCLVIVDLKLGEFTHADAGQMHLYVNYARENWMREGENPPVGLILCTKKGKNVARYALQGLPNKVLASTYRMTLPDEATLIAELDRTQRLMSRRIGPVGSPK